MVNAAERETTDVLGAFQSSDRKFPVLVLVQFVKKHAEVQLENVVETVDKKAFVQSNRFNDAV